MSITSRNEDNTCLIYGQYYDDNVEAQGRNNFTSGNPKNIERNGKPTAGRVGITFHHESGLAEKRYSPFQSEVLAPSFEEKKRQKGLAKFKMNLEKKTLY